jgi:hypothetical protein
MKVVCIDDYTLSGKKIKGLTVGKIYDVIDFSHSSPWVSQVIDDNGEEVWFNDEVLMPLEKYRELKLNELGI